ncbi:hypothetical protein ACFX2F_008479 [Malus domestica]
MDLNAMGFEYTRSSGLGVFMDDVQVDHTIQEYAWNQLLHCVFGVTDACFYGPFSSEFKVVSGVGRSGFCLVFGIWQR